MRFSENFEAAKNMAVEAAQTAAAKAKEQSKTENDEKV